jgi:protein gp37
MGHQLWGTRAPRRFFGDAHWREPLRWNDEAGIARTRERVFCASMADVFERRADLNPYRQRLWGLIESTPNLDWLLLTKRPQNVQRLAPWGSKWPMNVWLGTSVEDQHAAEQRLPLLLSVPAEVRFLSCEPLLGPLNLEQWFRRRELYPIDWVIAGGESGPKSRPMHPDWAKGLLRQCLRFEVPFHFKQWGHWVPIELMNGVRGATLVTLTNERPVRMVRLNKKVAGRILEGSTWDGVPRSSSHA